MDPAAITATVRRTLLSRFGASADSYLDDVAQDVTIIYLREREAVRFPREWVRKVAVNRYRRVRRRESRMPEGATPERSVPCRDQRIEIAELLASLGDAGRLIWRVDAMGEAPSDVARDLGIQANALGVRLHRARKSFRDRWSLAG